MSRILNTLKQIDAYNNYSHDDKGLGELFADVFPHKCRYNITTKSWFIYDGKRWIEDKESMRVSMYAKEFAKQLYQYANEIKYPELAEEYKKFAKKLGSLTKRKTMLEDARDKYHISNEKLDVDNYLFNCQNGTFNLKTFKLQHHNPNDLISKISNVIYDEKTTSNKFHKFIGEVMENNQEKIEYLQKILGYSLTGDTSQEEFYIFYGPSTRNGKTTLIEAYSNTLGNTQGYSISLNPESLASKQFINGSQASGDIAKLKGYRFVNANEAPQNMIFNANLLKKLTGRDTITARQIYQEEFDFKPSLKLFFNTNYLPIIGDNTLFTSDRVKVITFNKHFKENEQNKNLKNELKEHDTISEIFNWGIEGLKKFNKEGLKPPKDILKDTNEYKILSDKIGNFIKECLVYTGKNEKAKDVYEVYKKWNLDNGYGFENKDMFYTQLKSKNIFALHGTVKGKTQHNVVVGYEIKQYINSN